jgi:environmental stress-induced protein Ves
LFKILKYEKYREMPWRNGQGSTLEIAREPGDGKEFAWRLSLAKLERASNFSAYPGYRRALVLVSGEHLRLTFWGHGQRSLGPQDRCVRFEGSWRARCAVPLGPCMDLSLIVRDGSRSVLKAPRVLEVGSQHPLVIPCGLQTALLPLQGVVTISNPSRFRPRRLRPLDTLLLPPAPRRVLNLHTTQGAELVVLQWLPGRATNRKGDQAP